MKIAMLLISVLLFLATAVEARPAGGGGRQLSSWVALSDSQIRKCKVFRNYGASYPCCETKCKEKNSKWFDWRRCKKHCFRKGYKPNRK